jgi:glycosyltransferase involved in cell wall biosynthesis
MKESNSESRIPLISIGIPTYNRPEGVRRTLVEFTRQTYRNLEIIISDNASPTDATREVVAEFMRHDERIQYFKQPENLGPVNNFQFVLDQSHGEYFMWAADDDWRKPDFVEELYKKLSGDSAAVVAFCDFDSRDDRGDLVLGYPDFLDALRQMREPSSFLRQVRYFLINEGTAKPHPIYGLIRRDTLAGFSLANFFDLFGENAADCLFVFWLLTQGHLALVEKRLFGCTVGNHKEYASKNKWNIPTYLSFMGKQINYLFSYVRIAKGATRLVLVLLLPWKWLEIANLFVIKPGINVMKRRLPR